MIKDIGWTRKRWHGLDVWVHYRRFLSLPSVKLSWPSADPSSGQGGFLRLLPHPRAGSVAKAGGSCSQPLQSSQHRSELGFGGPKQGRAQRHLFYHPFYLSSLTAPFCTSHVSGSLPVQPAGKTNLQIFNRRELWQLSTLKVFSPYK